MGEFKKLSNATLPQLKEPVSEEALFWSTALDSNQVVKEYGNISKIDIDTDKSELLVSSASRISMYNINNMELKRSYSSRTEHSVYWGSFRRSDHRLFTSSTEEGLICVYETTSTKPIRMIGKGDKNQHSQAVRVSEFLSPHEIVSFSDDKHIKLWDLSDGSYLNDVGFDKSSQKTAHDDYIRAGCLIEVGPTLIASGSYDHSVKIWDIREDSLKPIHEFKMADPIECLVSRDSFLISSGLKSLRIYDLIAGKTMKIMNDIHSRTITSLNVYNDNIITASLDGHCKIYNNMFKLSASLNYAPSQLLSISVSSKGVVVGTNEGLVISRKFKSNEIDKKMKETFDEMMTGKHKRYFKLKRDFEELMDYPKDGKSNTVIKGKNKRHNKLDHCDMSLKKFECSKALDFAMQRSRSKPANVVSLLQEFNRRGVLRNTLTGRSLNQVTCLLVFLCDNIQDPKFSRILIDIALIFIDIYRPLITDNVELHSYFRDLYKKVDMEIDIMKKMLCIAGQVDLMLSNSNLID